MGCEPRDIPEVPMLLGRPTHCIRPTKSYPRLPSVTKSEREHTPPAFAVWLVELAAKCKAPYLLKCGATPAPQYVQTFGAARRGCRHD